MIHSHTVDRCAAWNANSERRCWSAQAVVAPRSAAKDTGRQPRTERDIRGAVLGCVNSSEPFAFTARTWAIEVQGWPAATAHVVGLSMGAIVAGELASVLPGVSLTLSAPALTKSSGEDRREAVRFRRRDQRAQAEP